MGNVVPPQVWQSYAARLELLIDRHGFAVQAVGPSADDDEPQFAYSVGLERQNKPELIITGVLPLRTLGNLINEVAALEQDLKPGDELEREHGVSLRIGAVSPAQAEERLTFANLHALRDEGDPVSALQILWPDAEGNFPGEDGYDTTLTQPVLAE